MRKIRGKCCALIFLLSAIFIGIILISSYHTTNLLTRLKARLIQVSTSGIGKWRKDISSNSTQIHISTTPSLLQENVVLIWTKYYGEDPIGSYGFDVISDPKCFVGCRIVTEKEYLEISDAVVFHSRDFKRRQELPPVHPWHQIWVYLQQESPSYTEVNLTEFQNVFNWTMTYRRDSDVYHPYYRILPVDPEEQSILNSSNFREVTNKKRSKLVAWIVSHCDTLGGREHYVAELSKFVAVDIYGNCGNLTCSHEGVGCIQDIAKDYKFYLSFENSACSDYVTEKFFLALKYKIVPVVYGGADYNLIAPPHSFINVQNFSSPKGLAEYLLELDEDEEKYLEYFKWANKFKVTHGGGWCALCQKLGQQKVDPVVKSYGNIHKWWFNVNFEEETGDDVNLIRGGDGGKVMRWIDLDLEPACRIPIFVMRMKT